MRDRAGRGAGSGCGRLGGGGPVLVVHPAAPVGDQRRRGAARQRYRARGAHRADLGRGSFAVVAGLLVLFAVGGSAPVPAVVTASVPAVVAARVPAVVAAQVAGAEDAAALALGVLQVGDAVEHGSQGRIEGRVRGAVQGVAA